MRVTMRQIATEVAQRHGLTLEDLRGPNAAQAYARPRWEAMAIIREKTAFSLPQIGRFFNRDHTSVFHGLQRHAALRCPQAMAKAVSRDTKARQIKAELGDNSV